MKAFRMGKLLLAIAIVLTAAGGPLAFTQQPGWLLVAAPSMPDPRFARTVILILQHGADGTKGVIVNRLIDTQPAGEVLQRMLGQRPMAKGGAKDVPIRIQFGGPVHTTRWTYIHSGDYRGSNTATVTGKVSLTSNPDILSDLTMGKGPARGFLAIGYAGWGPGQLAREMARKDWFAIPPDSGIVLDRQLATKWRRALDRRSVDL